MWYIGIKYAKDIVKAERDGNSYPDPPHLMVHGGAGTGKTFVIKTLPQWIQANLIYSIYLIYPIYLIYLLHKNIPNKPNIPNKHKIPNIPNKPNISNIPNIPDIHNVPIYII